MKRILHLKWESNPLICYSGAIILWLSPEITNKKNYSILFDHVWFQMTFYPTCVPPEKSQARPTKLLLLDFQKILYLPSPNPSLTHWRSPLIFSTTQFKMAPWPSMRVVLTGISMKCWSFSLLPSEKDKIQNNMYHRIHSNLKLHSPMAFKSLHYFEINISDWSL